MGENSRFENLDITHAESKAEESKNNVSKKHFFNREKLYKIIIGLEQCY